MACKTNEPIEQENPFEICLKSEDLENKKEKKLNNNRKSKASKREFLKEFFPNLSGSTSENYDSYSSSKFENCSVTSFRMGCFDLNYFDKSMEKDFYFGKESLVNNVKNLKFINSAKEDRRGRNFPYSLPFYYSKKNLSLIQEKNKKQNKYQLDTENMVLTNLGILSFRPLNISSNFQNINTTPQLPKILLNPPKQPSLLSESFSINMNSNINIRLKKSKIQQNKKNLPKAPSSPFYEINLLKFLIPEDDPDEIKLKNHDFTIYVNNGVFFKAEIKKFQLHGEGKLFINKGNDFFDDGNQNKELFYCGSFSKNRIQGKGRVFFMDDLHFNGLFKDGRAHGKGKLFDLKRGILVQGVWENGKLFYQKNLL